MADFSFSEDQELHKLSALVAGNLDDFEHWNKLVQAAESQENGINRNSSPNAITAMRETYDRFLARFPLFFAYWKRYADLEYKLAGTEAAESVYERGVASTGFSVDLWTNYCSFKVDTCHEAELIREQFDRGAEQIGMDFHAHPFWDKYIEYEMRSGEQSRLFQILVRILRIPLYEYARYYEHYRSLAPNRPVQELADPALLAQLQVIVQQETAAAAVSKPVDYTQAVRKKVQELAWENFQKIQQEVSIRWPFEQKNTRPYYHVTDLEDDQLDNWRQYLTFEEKQGDYTRIKLLYERCLVTTANYEEFWFRYVRWMTGQGDKTEEIRNIYVRASCIFIKITQPAIRLAWAKYEESQGRADVAAEIHEAILLLLPDDFATYKSLIQVRRRNDGLEATDELLQGLVVNNGISEETRGALLIEWVRHKWQLQDDYANAAAMLARYRGTLAASHAFWSGWLQLEIERPAKLGHEDETHQRIRKVHLMAQTTDALSEDALKALAAQYLMYLDVRGGPDAIKEAVLLDAFVNGPDTARMAKDYETLFDDGDINGAMPRLKEIVRNDA